MALQNWALETLARENDLELALQYLYTVEDYVKDLRLTYSSEFPQICLLVLNKKIHLFTRFKHDGESCPPGWPPLGFFVFGFLSVCLFFIRALAVASCCLPVLS